MSNSRLPSPPRGPRRGFSPPHCPNRDCAAYVPHPGWTAPRDGFYRRPSDGRRFQRFRCRLCARRFSTRTFAPDYWLRRRDLLLPSARFATEGPGLRQAARLLHTTHDTVGRLLSRAGRHALLLHQRLLPPQIRREPIAFDGFETFEFSQFFPFHLNLAVGAHSWFLYHFTDSPLRRKGAMTAAQKRRRAELEDRLGRPDPKAVEQGIVELLRPLQARVPAGAVFPLRCDAHPAYPRACRRLRPPGTPALRPAITRSTERRTPANPLFAVNLTDLLLRHSQAAHRRETIAFCKRRQGALERLAVLTVWRNLIKWRREKAPGETAAMAAGVCAQPWSWEKVFADRQFPRRELLPGPWWEYYWRRVRTAALGDAQTEHRLRYAF